MWKEHSTVHSLSFNIPHLSGMVRPWLHGANTLVGVEINQGKKIRVLNFAFFFSQILNSFYCISLMI